MPEPATLFIVPHVPSAEGNKNAVHDLAWERAMSLSSLRGDEVGGEEFLEYYNLYVERYGLCIEHVGFLQNLALQTMRELLHEKTIALMVPKEHESQDVIDVITDAAHIIVSSFLWAISSFPEDWVPNDEWNEMPDELRGVEFPSLSAAQPIVKDNDDNHDQ